MADRFLVLDVETRGRALHDPVAAVGHEVQAYLRMEENDDWRGTDRQSAALAEILRAENAA